MQEYMKYAAECDVLHMLSYDIFLLNKRAPTITAVWPLVLVSFLAETVETMVKQR